MATVLAVAGIGAAWAGPKEDMKALSLKFLALRSYHATMESSDSRMPKTQLDFVAPDRYRVEMGGMGTQVIVGDTMYMNINGRSMRVPMPKGTLSQWRETDRAFREIDKAQVEALGTEVVNGKPTRKYRVKQTTGGSPTSTLMWVGGDGYPVRVQSTGQAAGKTYITTMAYSRFNDPSIRIDVPK